MTSSWLSRASCAGHDAEVWFSRIPSYQSRARFVCSICPVKVPCIDAAITNGDSGIRGGLTRPERRQLHKRPVIHPAPYMEGVAS